MLTETSALTVDARRRRPRKVSAVGVMVHAIGISGGSGALVLAVLLVGRQERSMFVSSACSLEGAN